MAQRQQTGGRVKATVFLVGAVMVAALTAYLVIDVLHRAEQRVEKAGQIEKQMVVVAKNDLYMGLPIEEADLMVSEVLPGTAPADLIYADVAELIGQTPRERIYAGEFIRFERLARQDAGVGLNAIISPGKRAMTIETDTQSSLGGFLQPGNWVDVIVTIRPDDRTLGAKWVTETILQDVKVLAVGDSLAPRSKADDTAKQKKRSRQRPSVTLEVTPEEAQRLALAVSKGDLHLVLRSDVDKVQQESEGPLATDALLGIKKEEVKASKPRRSSRPKPTTNVQAEVIEGDASTSVEFDSAGNKVPGVESSRRRRR
jgi:pilus assembly protein CpaB